MSQVPISRQQMRDPFEKRVPGIGIGREGARTPMQWDASDFAGFSTVEPWLPVADDFRRRNVAQEVRDPASIHHLYQRLIAARRRCRARGNGGGGGASRRIKSRRRRWRRMLTFPSFDQDILTSSKVWRDAPHWRRERASIRRPPWDTVRFAYRPASSKITGRTSSIQDVGPGPSVEKSRCISTHR